jgi:predicted small metal-binding protein
MILSDNMMTTQLNHINKQHNMNNLQEGLADGVAARADVQQL